MGRLRHSAAATVWVSCPLHFTRRCAAMPATFPGERWISWAAELHVKENFEAERSTADAFRKKLSFFVSTAWKLREPCRLRSCLSWSSPQRPPLGRAFRLGMQERAGKGKARWPGAFAPETQRTAAWQFYPWAVSTSAARRSERQPVEVLCLFLHILL